MNTSKDIPHFQNLTLAELLASYDADFDVSAESLMVSGIAILDCISELSAANRDLHALNGFNLSTALNGVTTLLKLGVAANDLQSAQQLKEASSVINQLSAVVASGVKPC